jgi:hypothetical protein
MSKKTRKNNRKNSSTSNSSTPVVETPPTTVVEEPSVTTPVMETSEAPATETPSPTPATEPKKKSKPGFFRRTGRSVSKAAKTVAKHTPSPVKTGLEYAGKGAAVTAGALLTIAGVNKLTGDNE